MSASNKIRLVIPDSHGNHVDPKARAALLRDAKALDPDEVILLGDHLDCGGIFNTHQRTYTNELCESYEDDCAATNSFFDDLQAACPRATSWDYLEGNHEQHVERWAARTFTRRKDADALLEVYGPAKRLELKQRGIRYYKRSEHYQGLSIPGTIKRGKCFFTHGIVANKQATQTHLERFGACIVHGHTHRAQSTVLRTVVSDGIGAWCPGTLAKLQPLYLHTNPSGWSHGYHVQFVAKSGLFLAWNVPIMRGTSLLRETVNTISKRGRRAA